MSLSSLLIQAHDYFTNNLMPNLNKSSSLYAQLENASEPYVLFFSLSDGKQPARIIRATGKSPEDAFKNGRNRCQTEARRRKLNVSELQIDWPTAQHKITWGQLNKQLLLGQPNSFSYCLALDKELKDFLLKRQINSYTNLYPNSDKFTNLINTKNFINYIHNYFAEKAKINFYSSEIDLKPIYIFSCSKISINKNDIEVCYLSGLDKTSLLDGFLERDITVKELLNIFEPRELHSKLLLYISNTSSENKIKERDFINLSKRLVEQENYLGYLIFSNALKVIHKDIIVYTLSHHHAELLFLMSINDLDKSKDHLESIKALILSNKINPFFSLRYLEKKLLISKIMQQANPFNKLVLNILPINRRRLFVEDLLGIAEYIKLTQPNNTVLYKISILLSSIEKVAMFSTSHLEVAKNDQMNVSKYEKLVKKLAKLISQSKLDASWLPSQAWIILSLVCASKLYLKEHYLLRCLAREQALYEKELSNFHLAQYIRARAELQLELDKESFAQITAIDKAESEDKNYINARKYLYKEMSYMTYLYYGKVELYKQGVSTLPYYNKKLEEYLKDKTVALVGPVEVGLNNGKEIDSFDLVFRLNFRGLEGFSPEYFGTKTHFSGYADDTLRNISNEQLLKGMLQLDWVLREGKMAETIEQKINNSLVNLGEYYPVRTSSGANNSFFRSNPNAIQLTLIHLLQYPVKKLKIFNTDIFISTNYNPAYRQATLEAWHFLIHDMVSNFIFTQVLWKRGLIEVDEVLAKVLSMTEEEYIAAMDERYGAKL